MWTLLERSECSSQFLARTTTWRMAMDLGGNAEDGRTSLTQGWHYECSQWQHYRHCKYGYSGSKYIWCHLSTDWIFCWALSGDNVTMILMVLVDSTTSFLIVSNADVDVHFVIYSFSDSATTACISWFNSDIHVTPCWTVMAILLIDMTSIQNLMLTPGKYFYYWSCWLTEVTKDTAKLISI